MSAVELEVLSVRERSTAARSSQSGTANDWAGADEGSRNVHIVGCFEIDEACFELREHGLPVMIEPKVLEFILYLARHKTRVVTKRELLDQLWPGTCVVESVLSRCACLARQALANRKLIRTIYGRGYRWVGT
jgi:DNA-binding winged helix-turn-helix (wHTH) protein